MENSRALRPLGGTGFNVVPLCLGGNVFGWTADETMSFRILDAFVDAGFNFIDTADMYSGWVPGHEGGESEAVIGRWLKKSGKRKDVVIVTKVGHDQSKRGPGLTRDNILRCAEGSLGRLGVDCIDVYLSHRDDPATPVMETIEAYADLHKKGMVQSIGCSDFTVPRLQESLDASRTLGVLRYEVVQPEYNLLARGTFEGPLSELCAREGLGVMTYFGLARGFLSGKYRNEQDLAKSPRGPGVAKYLNARGFAVLDVLDEIAATTGSSPAAVALAWCSVLAPERGQSLLGAMQATRHQRLAVCEDQVFVVAAP